MSFTLITNGYDEKDLHRIAEYQICLARNLALDLFERVILVYEDNGLALTPSHPKLTVVHHGRRGSFSDYFTVAATLPPRCRVVLANADIFFDDSLAGLDRSLKGEFVCLSRWDELADGRSVPMENPESHDAWIFETPFELKGADFRLGVPGCDGRIAWLAQEARLTLSNPARSVRAHHLHQSGVRHYDEGKRVRGPYRQVWATELKQR